nr:hypothetical protein [Tanacetum cinerariifolium]
MTLIKAARTMLANSKLPTTFWVEAVNTACYVQNRVLVVKHHNKTPYELFYGRTPTSSHDDGFKPSSDDGKKVDEDPRNESECKDQEKEDNVNSTNNVNTVSLTINVAGTNKANDIGELLFDPDMPALEDVGTFDFSNEDEDDDAVADMNNLDTTIHVSPTPTTRIHKDHPLVQVIRDLHSTTQTRNMSKNLEEHGFVKQKNDGIFISQDKYVVKIQKKFMFTEVMNASTPIKTQKPLLKDKDGKEVDVPMYRYQVNLKVSHLHAVKRIFRYLKGQPKLCLWYLKDSSFDLVAYTDSVYARASMDRKSTTREQFWPTVVAKTINGKAKIHARVDGKKVISEASTIRDLQFADEEGVYYLPNSTIFEQLASIGFSGRITLLFSTKVVQSQLGKGSAMPTDPHHTPTILQPSTSQPQKTYKPRKPKRKVTQVPQLSGPIESVADEAIYKKLDDRLVRAATTTSSLEVEQDSGNINRTQSKATPSESSSQGTDSGGGPRCQEAMRDTTAQTRFESVSKHSNDSLLARDNEESLGDDASKQGRRIDDIDADDDITLVNVQADADNDLGCEEVFVEQEVVADKEKIDEVTLAQALTELKTSKPKAKGVVIQDLSESLTTTTIIPKQKSQDKGKGIMVEEPVKLKKKDQIRLDEEASLKLQVEFDEEVQRLAR